MRSWREGKSAGERALEGEIYRLREHREGERERERVRKGRDQGETDRLRDRQTDYTHCRFNAWLRVTISLAHMTPNAGYFSPGTCIATSWTVFSTLLLLWSQPHFKRTGQNAANTQKIVRARQAVENREEEGCVYSIPLSDLIGKLLELKYIRSTRAHRYHRLSL